MLYSEYTKYIKINKTKIGIFKNWITFRGDRISVAPLTTCCSTKNSCFFLLLRLFACFFVFFSFLCVSKPYVQSCLQFQFISWRWIIICISISMLAVANFWNLSLDMFELFIDNNLKNWFLIWDFDVSSLLGNIRCVI